MPSKKIGNDHFVDIDSNLVIKNMLDVKNTVLFEKNVGESIINDNSVGNSTTFSSKKLNELVKSKGVGLTYKTINGISILGSGNIVIESSSEDVSCKLTGLTSILENTQTTYQIEDFNSFSTYAVTVDNGTVSINGNIITATFTFNTSTSGVATMTVTKDTIPTTFNITILRNTVSKPVILSPVNNSINQPKNPTFVLSAFNSTGLPQTHISSRIEISLDAEFTQVIIVYTKTTGTLTEIAITSTMSFDTQYYARVSYTSDLITSEWSDTVGFVTIAAQSKWVAKLSGTNHEVFNSVVVDSAGNFIAVGYENSSTSGTNFESLIVKFDKECNVLWQKKLVGAKYDWFNSVATDSSGNYFAVGFERDTSNNTYDSTIVKFDTNGNVLWKKRLVGTKNDQFNGVTTDSLGNIIAVGYENSSTNGGTNDTLIVKFDTSGNLLWQKRLGGTSNDYFYSVATDSSDNYIAVGYEGTNDALIVKFDTNGNLLWQKRLGGTSNDYFYSVATDSSGNYIAVGFEYSSTNGGTTKALIAKFDTSGNLLWQKRLGGTNNDLFQSVTTDSSGNYIAVGKESSSTSGNNEAAIIVKFSSSGGLIWQRKLNGGVTDFFKSVTTDSLGNYIAVGYESSSTTGANNEALIAKFDSDGSIVIGALSTIPLLSLDNSILTLNNSVLTLNTPTSTLKTTTLTSADLAFALSNLSLSLTKSTY